MKLKLLGAIVGATFLLHMPIAAASTPDGATPAEEGICDSLIGGIPGLYGLCVAYCEAQDIDFLAPDKIKPSGPALLRAYKRKRGADGPEMPCHPDTQPPVNECPCWTQDELENSFITANVGSCGMHTDPTGTPIGTGFLGIDLNMNQIAAVMLDGSSCGRTGILDDGLVGTLEGVITDLTVDEAQACSTALNAACGTINPPVPL